ncbi:MAG: PD40 domain-containing protein [Cyanobacteria bacterium SBLK]|nr:PD40 domain-containing protein [Cyanobacteria bacterium SBLK]
MKRVALVVGINCYPFLSNEKGQPQDLQKAAEEANRIADLLGNYGDFEVYRFPTKEGTSQIDPRGEIGKKELGEAILQVFAPQGNVIPETALLYFAGHGWQKQVNGRSEGFLFASDSCPEEEDWGLSLQWLRKVLEVSQVRQQIVWLDCCHSGELFNFADTNLVTFFEKQQDRCFIAASREFEEAIGGVLTPALLEGLDPHKSSEGWVTNVSLAAFLEKTLKNAPQHPIIRNPGGEILLTGKQGIKGNVCPYKGLAYFDFNEEDPQYFYGRAALTRELLEKVRSRSFLAVLGMSGSGKSSVVRAGLLYQLKQGAIPGSSQWTIYTPFTPGEHPLSSFQQAVGVEIGQFEAVIKAAATERVVLAIDQFEEVFTLCREARERQLFFQGLLGAVERLKSKLCVVVVMRSDFFGKLTEKAYGGFAKAIEQNLLTVQPMSEGELKEAIVNPAEKVGLEIDRELVTQMIADVSGSPGNLPLMQYTLTQLWDEKKLNRLMLTDYTRLGGVKKALENHANGVYESLSEEEKKVAKRIFLELTRLGEGTEDTRKQVRQQDLIHSPQLREVVEGTIQKLANAKLLVTGEEEIAGKRVAVVNIAHEALIRNWGLLGQWLKDNRAALLRKQEIEDAAREWRDKGKGKDKNYLLQGTRLGAAEDYQQRFGESVPLSNLAQEFVRRSVTHRKNSRRTLAGTVSGVILGLAGLAGWALVNGADAQIRADSASSESLYASDRKLEALVAGIRAAKRLKSPLGMIGARSDTRIQAITALREAVYGLQEANRIEGHNGPVLDVDVSPNGELIASAGQDGTVKIWGREGKLLASVPEESPQNTQGKSIWESISAVAFSPDGELIAFPARQDIQLVNSQGQIFKILKYSGDESPLSDLGITKIRFSNNGKMIAYSGYDNKVWLKNIEGNLISVLPHESSIIDENVFDLSFSYDDKLIATASASGTIKLWDINGKLFKIVKHKQSENEVLSDFNRNYKSTVSTPVKPNISIRSSPVDYIFASAGADGFIKLWNFDGTLIKSFKAHNNEVLSINFNSTGNIIISSASDNTVKLWTRKGELIKTITGHTGVINEVHFTDDGKNIVTASDDGTVRIWELETINPDIVAEHRDSVTDIEFSPDGQKIVTTSKDKTIKLINRKTNSVTNLTNHNEEVTKVSFSPDGKFMISSERFGDFFNIWDQEGNLIKKIAYAFEYEDFGTIEEVEFSQKKNFIVSAGRFALGVWDDKGNPKYNIKVNPDDDIDISYWNLSISPNGEFISVYKNPNTRVFIEEGGLKIWDINNKKVFNLDGNKAAFSYDGTTIITSGGDGILRLYKINGELVKVLTGHNKFLTSVKFSPNNNMIASSSEDKTVRIWSRDGTLIETLEHEVPVTALDFSPNSKTLAAALDNGKVILWNLDIDNLLARGCDRIRDYLQNNPNVAPEDKKMCNGVPAPKNQSYSKSI